jgi:hypothetical protein
MSVTFSSEQIISTLTDYPYSVTTADLDGDGDIDVLSASSNDDTIAWFENNTAPVCFLAGTLIATPTGERPIESLQPGDLITTADVCSR